MSPARLVIFLGLMSGCILPDGRAPFIHHGEYPMGRIPRTASIGSGEVAVGAARIDITPPSDTPIWLAGFGFQRRMREVRDPIEVRCLFVDDGRRRVALVVADVVGLLRPTVQRVRRLVGNGIDVVVSSTHNHASPDTMGFWGPAVLYAVPHRSGVHASYLTVVEKRMAACVAKAAASAEPARWVAAEGKLPKGIAKNIRPPNLVDDALFVFEAIGRSKRAPIATIVSFGCHAETLGDRSRKLSAGFPGALRRHLESKRETTAIFINGALGGMVVPDFPIGAGERRRHTEVERIGRESAEASLALLERAEAIEVASVALVTAEVELAVDNDLFRTIERVGLIERRERGAEGGFVTEVGRLDLGPISFALFPGEPTPRVGRAAKALLAARGARFQGVIGLASDELGYLLAPDQFDDPEFGYEVSMSVGRGAAPTLQEALEALPGRRFSN